MRKIIWFVFVSALFVSCKHKNSILSLGIANYTNSAKHISLTVSSLIKVDKDVEVLKVIPSWEDFGNYSVPKGLHIYSVTCEGLSKTIVDSFDFKDDSYFIITLRDDLNKYERKDSLNISIIRKNKVDNLQ